MSLNEGYHNRIEPGAASAGDDQASGSGSTRGSNGNAAAAAHSAQLHQQMLSENTYLKPSKQAYFSDEKVLIPDDDRTNVSSNIGI